MILQIILILITIIFSYTNSYQYHVGGCLKTQTIKRTDTQVYTYKINVGNHWM